MTGTRTRLQRLIEERLDGATLDEFVQQRREMGASWRFIANAITEKTGIEITHTGLRKWFADDLADAETTPGSAR